MPDALKKFSKYLPSLWFGYPFIILWMVILAIIAIYPKGEFELWVNKISCASLDLPFMAISFMGNGWFAALVLVLFLFVDYKKAIPLLLTLLIVMLLTNLFKRMIFFQHFRPMWNFFFADFHRILFDAPVSYLRSFPSGHTMTAFAMAALFSLQFRRRFADVGFFTVAMLVGFSRIYLMQHYLVDILWGAILGCFSGTLGYFVCQQRFFPDLNRYSPAFFWEMIRNRIVKK